MEIWHAAVLGVLEGLTEFLPVSSTGHLILAARFLGLGGEAVKTFEIVIQGGALGAVLGLYRHRVAAMRRGIMGRDPAGRKLALNLGISFLPAAFFWLLLYGAIKRWLFGIWPVAAALAAGGVVMILFDRWERGRGMGRRGSLEEMTPRDALWIGLAQVFSLWPGTSRSMVTLVAGMGRGLSATAAAEYSFLLALPTLGAATLFDAVRGAGGLVSEIGLLPMAAGFLSAAFVAALAMRGLLAYLNRRGLGPFGWYRIGLAVAVAWTALH
jgi:undecaprenyl-diphosphatase